jgi:hypothetical protein
VVPLATVHVGVPAWRGSAPYLAETLDSVLRQAGADLRVLISVDGADDSVIALCGRFLADPRVTIVVQPSQLGWVGNCNVVLQAGWESGADFYCIHPSDDLMEPTYLDALLAVAQGNPRAAVVFSDIVAFGQLDSRISQSSVTGLVLTRQLRLLFRHFAAVAFRGLIRRSLFPDAPPLLWSEAREHFAADTLFVAKLAKRGSLIRLAEPLYRKRYHAENTHSTWGGWSDQVKIAAWTTHCAEMYRLALPVAASTAERRLLLAAARARLQQTEPRIGFGMLVAQMPPEEQRKVELAFDKEALGSGYVGSRLLSLLGLRREVRWREKAEKAAGFRP